MSNTVNTTTNAFEEYNPMSSTFITTHQIATEERKRRGTTTYTRVLTCETTHESGKRYYNVIITKDVYNITCQLADVGDSAEQSYAQVKIVMTDEFTYRFNFKYNYCAKAFYEELFDEVFLD